MFNPRLVLAGLRHCSPRHRLSSRASSAGCSRTHGPTAEELAAQARRDSSAAAEAAKLEAERQAERDRERMRREALATLQEMVFFDYDEAILTSDTEQRLRAKLEVLRSCPSVRLRMEGHADERGTSEYNIVLGNERAESGFPVLHRLRPRRGSFLNGLLRRGGAHRPGIRRGVVGPQPAGRVRHYGRG